MSNKNLSDSIYKEAWAQLYNAFGERIQNDEELELMDSVLQSVKLDFKEQQRQSIIPQVEIDAIELQQRMRDKGWE